MEIAKNNDQRDSGAYNETDDRGLAIHMTYSAPKWVVKAASAALTSASSERQSPPTVSTACTLTVDIRLEDVAKLLRYTLR